jgi:two-component system OmpR family response regulator
MAWSTATELDGRRMTTGYRILVVEDDRDLGDSLRDFLEGRGFSVEIARTIEAAHNCFRARAFNLVLLDLELPDGRGTEFITSARVRGLIPPVIVMSSRRLSGASSLKEIRYFMPKPLDLDALVTRIDSLVRTYFGG